MQCFKFEECISWLINSCQFACSQIWFDRKRWWVGVLQPQLRIQWTTLTSISFLLLMRILIRIRVVHQPEGFGRACLFEIFQKIFFGLEFFGRAFLHKIIWDCFLNLYFFDELFLMGIFWQYFFNKIFPTIFFEEIFQMRFFQRDFPKQIFTYQASGSK